MLPPAAYRALRSMELPRAAYHPPLVEVPAGNHRGRLLPLMVHPIAQFYPYLAPIQGKVI